MGVKLFAKDKRVKLLVFFLFGILLIFASSRAVAVFQQNSDNNKSLFDVQVINYSLAVAQVTSFNAEDVAEENKSIKEKLLNSIGVDINSQTSFLGKEISLYNINLPENPKEVSQSEVLIPYKLKDESIQKEILDPNPKPVVITPVNPDKPVVLIYHTHTTESYGGPTNNSSDETKNVCAVGDALESELEKNYGIKTIHDKTVHDELGDIVAYSKSRTTVQKYLAEYKDFKLIIDIHRDSSSNKNNDIIKLNGETVAKAMFVLCKEGPYGDKNWAIATKMLSISNKLFPGFFKKDIYPFNSGTLFFNQDLSSNSILIEVGTNLNTVAEATASSKYLAKIIAEYLKS